MPRKTIGIAIAASVAAAGLAAATPPVTALASVERSGQQPGDHLKLICYGSNIDKLPSAKRAPRSCRVLAGDEYLTVIRLSNITWDRWGYNPSGSAVVKMRFQKSKRYEIGLRQIRIASVAGSGPYQQEAEVFGRLIIRRPEGWAQRFRLLIATVRP